MSRRIDKQSPVQSCAICFPPFSNRCSTFSCRDHVEISIYNEVSARGPLIIVGELSGLPYSARGVLAYWIWAQDGAAMAIQSQLRHCDSES